MAKQSRKELLNPNDAFLSAAGQGAEWYEKHQRTVKLALIAVMVAVVGVWGIVSMQSAKRANLSDAFSEALKIVEAPVGMTPPAEGEATDKPKAATPPDVFASKEEKWRAAREKFAAIAEDGGDAKLGNAAQLFVADLTEKLGELDKAEAAFNELTEHLGADDSLYFLSIERLAYLQENRGNLDGALATWNRLIEQEAQFYGDHASYQKARLLVAKGDTTSARQILEGVEKKYPNSAVAPDVKKLLDRVGRTAVTATDTVAKEQGTP